MRFVLLLSIFSFGLSSLAAEAPKFLKDSDYPDHAVNEYIPEGTTLAFQSPVTLINKSGKDQTIRSKKFIGNDYSLLNRFWQEIKYRTGNNYEYLGNSFVCDLSAHLPGNTLLLIQPGDQFTVSFEETERFRETFPKTDYRKLEEYAYRKAYVFVSDAGSKLFVACYINYGTRDYYPLVYGVKDIESAFAKDPDQPVLYIGPRLSSVR